MLDGIPIVDLSAGGIVVLVVLLILTRRLVGRIDLEDERKRTAEWREAFTDQAAANRVLIDTNNRLMSGVENADKLLRSLPVEEGADDAP